MLFFWTLLATNAHLMSSADSVTNYVDDLLSIYIPRSVEQSDLSVYAMPDFSHNYQNRSDEGTMIRGKIFYHSGNMTGLKVVRKKTCSPPAWSSGNLTFTCSLQFPQLVVRYSGTVQKLTSTSSMARFQHWHFDVRGYFKDVEFDLEITTAPQIKVSSVKRIRIVDQGAQSLRYNTTEDISYEMLSMHFYHKYKDIFQELFDADYRDAIKKALAESPYAVKDPYS